MFYLVRLSHNRNNRPANRYSGKNKAGIKKCRPSNYKIFLKVIPLNIVCMQKLMSLVAVGLAEKLLVKRYNIRVIV